MKTIQGMARRAGAAATLILLACAPIDEPGADPEPRTADGGARDEAGDLVPAGYGTLRQDDVSLTIRSGAIQIKLTPLAESVTRLTAPDTYERLSALARARYEEAQRRSGVERPALFLASVFSYERDARYEPEDVELLQRGRVYRPLAIVPVTSGWGGQQLEQQETQSAIYVFDPDIDLEIGLNAEYQQARSGDWGSIIPRLEAERSRVRSRARS